MKAVEFLRAVWYGTCGVVGWNLTDIIRAVKR